jgi:hypothetical protein
MKLILPAKLVAIALLMASSFLYAQDNHTLCTLVEGDNTVLAIHMEAFECPQTACVASTATPGIYCEIERTDTCFSYLATGGHLRNREAWPMKYTGNSCSDPTPFPDAPVVVAPVPLTPPVEIVPSTPEDLKPENVSSALANIQNELHNQRILAQNVHDDFNLMSIAFNANFSKQIQRSDQNSYQIMDLMSAHFQSAQQQRSAIQNMVNNMSFQINDGTNAIRSDIAASRVSLSDKIVTAYELLNEDIDASASQLSQSLATVDSSVQYNKSMIENIWNAIGVNSGGGCGGFDCPPSYTLAQILEINQQQLLDALSSGGSGDEQTNLLNAIEGNTYDSYRKLRDIEDLLESIDQNTASGSGGTGTDLTATNQKLDTIDNSLNNINLTLQNNQQGLSMQLGQQLSGIQSAIENSAGGGAEPGQGDTVAHGKLDGLGEKLDGIKGTLDGLADTSGFAQDLADGTAQGKSDLNQLLDGYDASTMLTDRFKQITDEAEKTLKDSGLSNFSDPSKFINSSGFVKPETFDDLVSFAQQQNCSPYSMTIHGKQHQLDLCRYANKSSSFLNYVFAVLTAIFCFVMISQTLINERLS